jgi:hypothetical protein
LYKRIHSARDSAGLRELQVEMIDRFGPLPEPTKNLFALAELRLLAERVGITCPTLPAGRPRSSWNRRGPIRRPDPLAAGGRWKAAHGGRMLRILEQQGRRRRGSRRREYCSNDCIRTT